jgi:phosphohistidine phosphatase SixA
MRVLLVRHARAGERATWDGDDRLRPLDSKGREQAKRLAKILAAQGATRLVSSPYVRCVETLAPASRRLDLPIEERSELAEGASAEQVLTLVSELSGSLPALSTHGDVIGELLGPQTRCKKGSIWVLEVDGRDVRPETYLPPD